MDSCIQFGLVVLKAKSCCALEKIEKNTCGSL